MLRLSLQRYRRYDAPLTLDFHPGLTIVTGVNGAGKSTLTEAILNALFGSARGCDPTSDRPGGPWRAALTLSCGGVRLCVTHQGGQAAVEVDGQPLVTLGPRSREAARAVVQKHLGTLGRENFERVYFALQGQTEALVSLKAAERKRLIEDVLQLDVVSTARELQEARQGEALQTLRTVLATLVHVAARLHGAPDLRAAAQPVHTARTVESRAPYLGTLNAELDVSLRLHVAHRDTLAAQLHDAQHACNRAAHQRVEAQAALDFAGNVLQNLDDVRETDADLQGAIREARGERRGLEQILQMRVEERDASLACAGAADQWASARARHTAAQQLLQTLQAQAPLALAYEVATAEVERCLARVQCHLPVNHTEPDPAMALEAARSRWEVMQADPTSQNLATIAAQAQVLEDRRTEYLTSAATLGLSELACPTCGLELTDHGRTERAAHLQTWLTHTYAQDYEALRLRRLTGEKEKSRWQREREELRQRVSQLDQQRKQAEETAAHRAGDEQRHRESVAALNATAARCEALGVPLPFDHVRERKIQDELVRLASEIDQLQSQKVLYDRREEYVGGVAETKQKLCDQDRTIENLESGRTTLAYDAAAHQQAKDAHRGATVMSQEAVLHVERQTTVLRDVQQELRRIDVAHAEAIAAARTLDDAVLALRREALLVTKLTAFQQHFFAVNTWEVVQRASALVQTIVDSSIRGLVLERGGHLLYRDAGYVKRDVSRLSGGEKALVGLCLRLALAERAQRIAGSQQVRFLVLDEVLSSLDDHRRDQVQHVLHEVLRNGLFEHIIMITHIDDIKKNWRAHRLDVTKVDEDISRADMVYLPTGI